MSDSKRTYPAISQAFFGICAEQGIDVSDCSDLSSAMEYAAELIDRRARTAKSAKRNVIDLIEELAMLGLGPVGQATGEAPAMLNGARETDGFDGSSA